MIPRSVVTTLLVVALGPGAIPLVAQTLPTRSGGALPYDLAFDMRDFEGTVAVSADGSRIAYSVISVPEDANRDVRYLPNGSPGSVTGATQLLVTERRTNETRNVCPGGNCWRPAWSPDGGILAFYSDRDGPPQLWVYDVTAGRARKVTDARIKAKLWDGDEAQWSPDGQTVYVPMAPADGPGAWLPESEQAPSFRPPTPDPEVTVYRAGSEDVQQEVESGGGDAAVAASQLFSYRENNADMVAVDVRTGNMRILSPANSPARPSVLRLSASGRWLTSLSAFKRHGATTQVNTLDLAIVSTRGGDVRIIAHDLPSLQTDYHHLNYAWHPTEDRLVYIKDNALWLVDITDVGPSPPQRLGEELGALAPTIHWFTRDGNAVVVGIDPADDQEYGDARPTGLAHIPLAGGAISRVAFPDGWTYRDIVKADPRTLWQPGGVSAVVVVRNATTGETGLVRLDLRSGYNTVLWSALARLREVRAVGESDEVIAIHDDVSTPPDVVAFSADFTARGRISHIEPRLDSVGAGSAEIFETTVPLHDGTLDTVKTAVILPPGAKRGDRLPAIVAIYPGGDQSTRAERFGGGDAATVPALVFTSRGYAVLHVHLKLGPNREAGNPLDEMVDVLLPQVYRAAELGYIDIQRVAITGQSFGGYGTASIISGTNLFRAAVAVSGIYDLAGTYGYMAPDGSNFWVGWAEGGQARMGTHPWANLPRYLENSPYYRADRIHTPLLIVHGDDDMAYHDGVKLFSALKRLERPAQLASYHGEGHVIWNWRRKNAADAAGRMVEFYDRHLLGSRPSTN